MRPHVDELNLCTCVCFSAAGVSQRSEEAAGGKRQTEKRYRAAERSAARETEETHRYTNFILTLTLKPSLNHKQPFRDMRTKNVFLVRKEFY